IVDGQDVTTTAGGVSVAADRTGKIDAKSVAASLGIGIGTGSGGVAVSGAGATAQNTIGGNSTATIEGGMIDSAGAVDVTAGLSSDIDALVAAASAAVGADPSAGIGASIGASLAFNTIDGAVTA